MARRATFEQTGCGTLTVGAEPSFDAGLVTIPTGNCAVSPRDVGAGDTVSLTATVVNQNDVPVIVTVSWNWLSERLAVADIEVPANGEATLNEQGTPQSEGSAEVQAEIVSSIGLLQAAAAATPTAEAHQPAPVTDGGVDARGCGGCAERSRKLSMRNQRIRDSFAGSRTERRSTSSSLLSMSPAEALGGR